MGKNTTIQISQSTKVMLDKLKVHQREPYEDVIRELIKSREQHEKDL